MPQRRRICGEINTNRPPGQERKIMERELVIELATALKKIAEGTGIDALDMRIEAKTCLDKYKKEIKEVCMRELYETFEDAINEANIERKRK